MLNTVAEDIWKGNNKDNINVMNIGVNFKLVLERVNY